MSSEVTVKRLLSIDNVEIVEQIQGISELLGCKGFSYAVQPKSKKGDSIIVSNFPQHWQTRYEKLSFHHIDPIMTCAKKSMQPFHWADAGSKPYQDVRNIQISDHTIPGVLNGYTIPLHDHMDNVVAFSVWSDSSSRKPYHPMSDDIYRKIINLHGMVLNNKNKVADSELHILSTRELQVLFLYESGKTYREIAHNLSISENTIKFHVKNILTKLNSSNMRQAIVALRKDF
ncbi:LuxR family transcriptional regulator [Providencia rettgeri]|uniref:LuxR family transcriptional regulator n=1 Tax=Providencia rettgeri TaxID=587 RepID=A0AAP2JV95_PRORE|nr:MULTISPECIES: LuxR family transcriptional regulator [Providencia]EJV1663838.1 LuxR family transcriptional regulator [Klebsiella pneumoniae]THB23709.1 LuxR family transcriptional regulator [Providencia sp. MGF014]HEJ9454287.1 LuxR family transcriptional regulator [Proteus mirabilis]MBX6949190.1 LuxR family transcriptional regulator [Providencia rettgeri]MBX6956305.1 LuxR family transcriptional regulator [Providencia rettgeri]